MSSADRNREILDDESWNAAEPKMKEEGRMHARSHHRRVIY